MIDPHRRAALTLQMYEAAYPDATTDEPELLPSRLAKACAEVLLVDGAGLSVFTSTDMRVPIGASEEHAAMAERLQFTLAEGPCYTAHDDRQASWSTEDQLAQHWPRYHQELIRHTPYRAVVCIPLQRGLQGMVALDLYLRDSDRIVDLQPADVQAAADTITSLLSDMPHDSGTGGSPKWLDNPLVDHRAKVWVAMGLVNAGLHLSTSDALAVLRAYSYGHGQTVEDTADALYSRTLPVAALLGR